MEIKKTERSCPTYSTNPETACCCQLRRLLNPNGRASRSCWDGWQERFEHPRAQLTVPPASLISLFSGPRPSLTTPAYKGVLPRRDGPPRPQGDRPATDPWGCSYNRQHRGWLRGPRAPFGGAGTELAAQAAGGGGLGAADSPGA